MSISRQFTFIALSGVLLAVCGMALTLYGAYGQAQQARQDEVRHLTQVGATIVKAFTQQAESGAMPVATAQHEALAALSAIRYDGVNYYFVITDKGVMITHPNKALIGKNELDLKDPFGTPIFAPLIAVAMAGAPALHFYYFPKVPGGTPQPKASFGMEIPEWHWVVGTGLYTNDINDALISRAIWLGSIFLPIFVIFLVLALLTRRSLSKLLTNFSNSMRELAQGNLTTTITGQDRTDEVGAMAKAVQVFKDNALRARALELEQREASARRAIEDEQVRRDTEAAAATMVVGSIGKGLEALSSGDLAFRLTTMLPDAYEKLRHDFNGAMEQLATLVRNIVAITGSISHGSTAIAQGADDLSKRTEQQAASLEESAAALEQLTTTVRKTAESAMKVSLVVARTKTDAQQTGEVVRKATGAMGNIERSSSEIGQIIGVIDEIAFQTNLLALNAGVEAARAGDSGRGFAVVASEVRALAQRSAAAAKQIKTLIATSTGEVGIGVDLVGEASKSLDRIVSQVSDITISVTEMAQSAQEQATGLHEVNAAVNHMDRVTQQNNAMVEESTAASHALDQETAELVELTKQFRTEAAGSPARISRPPGNRAMLKLA
ncbi:methyl-accepting chemotaxis protein [Acidisoma sp.]|uniref:methyl-accepting chemotaxis protein n=1 Tax=Acidisoma sp. TaxID=1872115 RepID=UPI003AFF6323